MRCKKNAVIALVTAIVLTLCRPAFSADVRLLRVAIAANLSTVITELKADFLKDNKDVQFVVIPGSSGKLTSQILSGAPYDVFLSADTEYPQKIKDAGLAAYGPEVYACGKLILFTTLKMDLSGGITVTATDEVKKIAIANPKTAPYGMAAVAALEKAGLAEAVKNKCVYAENISAVAQYVMTSAEIGFLAKSIVFDKELKNFNKEGVFWVDVDPSLYPKLEQSMVILKRASENTAAKAFYAYMLSAAAKDIMKKYGYYFENEGVKQ
jgi:molybdate transport system substrate-binding protein